MRPLLDIVSVGMVTAVGLDAPSSCAAMRARLDGFQETAFVDLDGELLLGAPVDMPRKWIGEKRLVRMIAAAINEACEGLADILQHAPILLCLPESERPGSPIADAASFLQALCAFIEIAPHPRSQLIRHGRPSGLVAVDRARHLLGTHDAVIVAGVDSYLTPGSIGHYLGDGRLLATNNPNGFIPGEAAAAVVCTRGLAQGLSLVGIGLSREPASIYNEADVPFHGHGMTAAYSTALNEAGIEMNQMGYRISDLIGEQYWFKQTALANLRLVRGGHGFQDLWSSAESLGNIGAAAVPVMMGMALAAASKGYAAGNPALIEASNDAGACGAAILAARMLQ